MHLSNNYLGGVLKDIDDAKYHSRYKTPVRGEENSMKAMGLMALLLAKYSEDFTHHGKISSSEISRKILQLAAQLGVDDKGVKTISVDINKSLEYVCKKYKIKMDKW